MPHGRSPFHSFDAPAESSGFAAAQCHGKIFLYLHIGGGAAHRILKDSADIFSTFVFWFSGYVYAIDLDFTGIDRIYACDHI